MPQRPEFLKHGQPVRLQAFLARSGVASRRGAEEMISHGRISVNGATVTAMGTTVRPGMDRVAVDGEEVKVAPLTWIALHKPAGYVTSRDDPFGRRTVYELLPEKYHGLFHVGRLDRDSEGLLLLTNDGELAHRLLHPSYGVTKEYDVVAAGKPSDAALRQLVEGVELEDGIARAESAKLLGPAGNGQSRLKLVLREGKKREVRRMLEALGHPVKRLVRRRFGPVALAELPKGKYRVVAPEELAHAAEKPSKRSARPPREDAPAKGPAARPKKPSAERERPATGGERPARAPRRAPEERPTRPRRGAGEGGETPPKRRSSAAPPARGGRPARPAKREDERPAKRDGARQEGARRPPARERPPRDEDERRERPAGRGAAPRGKPSPGGKPRPGAGSGPKPKPKPKPGGGSAKPKATRNPEGRRPAQKRPPGKGRR